MCLVSEDDIAARILKDITVRHLLGGCGDQIPGNAQHPQQDRGDHDCSVAFMHKRTLLGSFVKPYTVTTGDPSPTILKREEEVIRYTGMSDGLPYNYVRDLTIELADAI